MLAVAALSAKAETAATVINYNSAWLSWAKQLNIFPIPPSFVPQVQVFCYSTAADVAGVRVTVKADGRHFVRVYPADGCGGVIEGDFAAVESATVEPLFARGTQQAAVQQRP